MALITLRDVSWGFGGPPLLDDVALQIEKGARLALVGRNGAGKSTLLKLLAGAVTPDSGDLWRQQGLTTAAVPQDVPQHMAGTVFDVVAAGFGDAGRTAAALRRPGDGSAVGAGEHWEIIQRTEGMISRAGLDPDRQFSNLSAGMKRRTLFARAMAPDPDLLLLDEPTNHLDIPAIEWMEDYILRHVNTLVCVTHDRAFLKRVATGILDLDRGRLTTYHCDWDTFLDRRQAVLAAAAAHQRREDKKLAEEEAWIRQGIKARRTRNEGRVRALKQMREVVRRRRKETGSVRLRIQEAERTGKLVIEAKHIGIAWEGHALVDDLSTVIMRGDRVGIIGPNGCGKTSLLQVLLKRLAPDTGRLRHGTRLQVAYFDQLRAQLDPEKTVAENVGEGNAFIVFNGVKRHVMGYLGDFLFTPERCRTPVRVLSGGEKNRLLLARLFTAPANVLVLDEPTNDLDAETLELLEDRLFGFDGTLLLVSHDRAFLNNVVTSTLVFEGDGRVVEYAGGYDDWLLQRPAPQSPAPVEKPDAAAVKTPARTQKTKKLGYLQQRELDALPSRIEALEAEHAAVSAALSDPALYQDDGADIRELATRLTALEGDIAAAYARWEELEAIVSAHP